MNDFKDLASFTPKISGKDPTSFQEDMSNKDKDRYLGAIVEEMESLHKNKTWKPVELPMKACYSVNGSTK